MRGPTRSAARCEGGPAGMIVRLPAARDFHQDVAPGQFARQHVGESFIGRESKFAMHAGPSQIAIDDERLLSLTRVRNGKMRGGGGFSFARTGAGDQNRTQALVKIAKQNGIAQGTYGFLETGDGAIVSLAVIAVVAIGSSSCHFSIHLC